MATQQYSTVARIFIDKNIHRGFSSSYATVGVALIDVKTDTLDTSSPSFASSWDVNASRFENHSVELQFHIEKTRLHSNILNESYSDSEYVINSLTPVTFELAETFVKATKRIKNSIKRKNPDIEAFRGCVTEYIEKFLEAAKVNALWFEAYNETTSDDRFKTYAKEDLDALMVEAAIMLK